MKKFYLFLFLILAGSVNSQNWQNVCSNGVTFFAMDSVMQAFRADLVSVTGTDSTFYSYQTIRDTTYEPTCLDTTHGGLLGPKVIQTHDGWYYFLNRNNDTIKINALAGTGQNWRFCNLSGGGYVIATVAGITTETVLGQSDQVKTINLQAKDAGGNDIPHPLNSHPFKLSQHYGLTQFYDVYKLPETVETYILKGKTQSQLGLQDFGWKEVYDFAVGDEFHYTGRGGVGTGGGATWKTILTVLDKIAYGNDSVTYVFRQCKRLDAGPPPTTTSTIDTITVKYNFIQLNASGNFMALPDELINIDGGANKFERRCDVFNGRQKKIFNGYVYWWNVSIPGCWTFSMADIMGIDEYAPGLGMTADIQEEIGYEHVENLVYFRKGTETWGTPVAASCEVLTGVNDAPAVSTTVSVYPNPASDKITVTISGKNTDFVLYDLSCRQVKTVSLKTGNNTISISNLPKGIYFWKAGEATGKIVKL